MRKVCYFVLAFVILFLLTGCVDSSLKDNYDDLKWDYDSLKMEYDDLLSEYKSLINHYDSYNNPEEYSYKDRYYNDPEDALLDLFAYFDDRIGTPEQCRRAVEYLYSYINGITPI